MERSTGIASGLIFGGAMFIAGMVVERNVINDEPGSAAPAPETTVAGVLPTTGGAETTVPPTTTAPGAPITYPLSKVVCYGPEVPVTVTGEDVITVGGVATHSFLKAANRTTGKTFYTQIAAPPANNADGFMADLYNRNGLPVPASFDDLPGVTLKVGTNCIETD